MATDQQTVVTKVELMEVLKEALKPIKDDLNHVKQRVNQMYDALEKYGLPMLPPKP